MHSLTDFFVILRGNTVITLMTDDTSQKEGKDCITSLLEFGIIINVIGAKSRVYVEMQ